MASKLEKLFARKNGKSRITESASVLKTVDLDELIAESMADFTDDDSTEGLDEFDAEDDAPEMDDLDYGSDDMEESEGATDIEHDEDGTITITLKKGATVAELVSALQDVLVDSDAGDIELTPEDIQQAEDELADELGGEDEDEGDSEDADEEPAADDEDGADVPDLGSHFVDEDEETIDFDGASGNVKANGSVGAPKRSVAGKEYNNSKTVKTSIQTQSGEGTPASTVGAPKRSTHNKSYKNGKTVDSNLNPGRSIVGA